jgi:molybdate transport system substrate-binding protein
MAEKVFAPRLVSTLFAVVAALLSATVPVRAESGDAIIVFAAASLKNALDATVDDYTSRTGAAVSISYAGSSTLAKQIEEGAPADIFLSANIDWMDRLTDMGAMDVPSRVTLLGNSIVLVAPKESTLALAIAPGFALAEALGDGRLAMAETTSVPAGIYGRAALESLGVWEGVANRVAQADNVRAALALVSRGEAPLGIVYATDAKADVNVRVVDTFPADSHPPILCPAALTASAKPAARDLFAFLVSPAAKRFYEEQGFAFVAPGS